MQILTAAKNKEKITLKLDCTKKRNGRGEKIGREIYI